MRFPLAFAAFAMMTTSALADGAPNDDSGYSGGSSAMQTAAMLVKTGRYEDAIPKLQKLVLTNRRTRMFSTCSVSAFARPAILKTRASHMHARWRWIPVIWAHWNIRESFS